jgi:hypothetical protein
MKTTYYNYSYIYDIKDDWFLFTENELKFYYEFKTFLEKNNMNYYMILPKVRLADIFDIKKWISSQNFWIYFSKIAQKHIDFTLCSKNWKIVACIELDWYSHWYTNKSEKNDDFKDKIFQDLWIPFFRIKNGEKYHFGILITKIKQQRGL